MQQRMSILILVVLFYCSNAFAQNVHFSQFYQAPLLTNPALTGVFNGDMRAIVNYRQQWASIAEPFTTYAFSYDMGLLKKKKTNKYLGAGIFAFRDVAGDTKYSTTSVNLSLSSIITLDGGHDLSAGLQGGFSQKSIDESTFRWGSNFDGTGYNPTWGTSETTSFENYTFGDFSAGLSWSYGKESSTMSSNNHFAVSAGIAVYHVNAPKLEFDTQDLYREFVIHSGMYIGLKNTPLSVLPNFIMMIQGPSTVVNLGGLIRYSIREESKYTGLLKETAILFGMYSRLGDAIIPTLMLEVTNYALVFSYDLNTSGLKEATNGNGGLEVSFRFINPNPFKYGKGTRYKKRSLF